MKIIISGGGTAGHIYPAIATAQVLKENFGAEILFIGASERMEMDKVPKAGFEIIGLPVEGLKRKITHKNLIVLAKYIRSLIKARGIVKRWKPDAVVGFGGYASAPVIKAAQHFSIPTILQEQNSFPGIANRLHAKYAKVICTAYDGMERFFPNTRIVKTGNPLRVKYYNAFTDEKRREAYKYFNLQPGYITVVVTGGSLGAGTINGAMEKLVKSDPNPPVPIQIIWQTGAYYWEREFDFYDKNGGISIPIKITSFIDRMDLAYAIADMIVCRAGASTISEIQMLGIPAVFVPSPNVAEDHQTHNAEALVEKQAAIMIKDCELGDKLLEVITTLAVDENRRRTISENVRKMGVYNSAEQVSELIVEEIEKDKRVKNAK